MASRQKVIMALDAGGGSTKGMLTDLHCKNLGAASDQPFNLRQSDPMRFRTIVDKLARKLFLAADLPVLVPDAVAVGLAGGGDVDDRKQIENVLKKRWPNSLILVHHDAYIAQYGAFGGNAGIIITSGTGSIAYGRNEKGEESRSGGWGWMLGDEGSAWWIGREALRRVLQAFEEDDTTMLTDRILSTLSISHPYDILSAIYKERFNREKITSLAPMVSECAAESDIIANEILFDAGKELGKLALSISKRLNIHPHALYVSMMGKVSLEAHTSLNDGLISKLMEYKHQVEKNEAQLRKLDADLNPERQNAAGTSVTSPSDPQNIKMPEFPPKEIAMKQRPGPCLVEPEGDALHGAAIWARDELLKRKFV